MKKRTLYALLFAVPGLVIALTAAFALAGFGAGVMWLSLFGDAPWPAGAETVLMLLFFLTFAGVWLGSIVLGWTVGKRLEGKPSHLTSHVFIAAGVTLGAVGLIMLHQWGVGNIGPTTDTARCAAYCEELGFYVSSMPPRNTGRSVCRCLDDNGRVVLSVPLQTVDAPQ